MLEPFSSGPQAAQDESEKADLVVYVEELGGEGDYWLSITDAARVCRVQDVSIRRAIAKGGLPVRRQRAGQNKRTRFVRASDLPRVGFPIIDESAAITTEIGKADILSIPRQQQRIVQDHQQLLSDLAELQTTIASHQAQVRVDLQEQRVASQSALLAAQQEQMHQHSLLEARLSQELAHLTQALIDAEQRLTEKHQTLCQELAQVQTETRQSVEGIHKLLRAQQAELTAYQQESQRALTELASNQQQSMREYQAHIQEQLQKTEQMMRESQQNLIEKLQQAEQRINARLEDHKRLLTSRFEEQTHAFETSVATLAEKLSMAQHAIEQLEQRFSDRDQEMVRQLQAQQEQLRQHERLLPLLPYIQWRLLTEEDEQRWKQVLANLEERLLAAQHREQERYQPLLALLAPEHLETLSRLLKNNTSQE